MYGNITTLQCYRLPGGLIAQLVEHCTGIAEVMGSNSSLNVGVLCPFSVKSLYVNNELHTASTNMRQKCVEESKQQLKFAKTSLH